MSSLPFNIHSQLFGEIFASNPWLVNRSGNILFRSKDPSLGIVPVISMSFDLSGRAPVSSGEPPTSVVGTRGTRFKGQGQVVNLWSIGYGRFLPLPITHTRWNDDVLQDHVLVADTYHSGQMK